MWVEDCAGSAPKRGLQTYVMRHRPSLPTVSSARPFVSCRPQKKFVRTRMRQRRTTDGQCGSLGHARDTLLPRTNNNVSSHPVSHPPAPLLPPVASRRPIRFGATLVLRGRRLRCQPVIGEYHPDPLCSEVLRYRCSFCGLRQPAPPGCRPFPLETGAGR